MTVAACGGGAGSDDAVTTARPSGGAGSQSTSQTTEQAGVDAAVAGAADVVDKQEPGKGIAKVDGLEYTFDTPGGLDCAVSADEFSFSFIIGNNEITLGGGASSTSGEWFGSMSLMIFGEDGVTQYSADLLDNPAGIAVDGISVSYSGPMLRYPPAPAGQIAEPEAAGDGVFSATCA